MSFIWRDNFFSKIGIFCMSILGPLSETKMHWMLNWLQLLNQLNFVWRLTKVFMQNSSQWCLRNVKFLRTIVNWCWWRFQHILLQQQYSLLPKSVCNFRTHSATLPWFSKLCRNISQRCSSVYTTIFVRRQDKTNYLSNQTQAKC